MRASLGLRLLTACDGPQSALAPGGRDAAQISELFWWMTGGAAVIWAVVIATALYAIFWKREAFEERLARLFIVGGGVVFPTVVLTGLLIYGLSRMPALLDLGPPSDLRVEVVGEQWWWRVRYVTSEGAVELANELALPVGRRTALALSSPDVIHAFWVPSLGGKMDMVPGRITWIALEPTRPGVYRGACAEYCGESHAFMAFYTLALEAGEFEAWLQRQRQPARQPETPLEARGQRLFLSNGCGACHTIRGTSADGVIGPDLTHVGSRRSLGAGLLDNDVDAFVSWLSRTDHLKPGVYMPSFGMLEDAELLALATYLDGLE